MALTVSKKELKELLGIDPVPGFWQNTWNSLVVNRQIDSLFLMPWDSIARTEFMVRLWQGSEEPKLYHGDQANLLPRDLKAGASYYELTSGIGMSRSCRFEIGVVGTGIIAVPEAIGHIPAGPFFPQERGLMQIPLAGFWFEYNDPKRMPVRFDMDPTSFAEGVMYKGFDLESPEDRSSAEASLKIMRDAVKDIVADKGLDVDALRQRFREEAGLACKNTAADLSLVGQATPVRNEHVSRFDRRLG